MLKMPDVLAGSREDFDETETVAATSRAGSVLLRIGDEESTADVLNIERREAAGNFLGFERLFSKARGLEIVS